jgi:hypothetical protein
LTSSSHYEKAESNIQRKKKPGKGETRAAVDAVKEAIIAGKKKAR